MLTGNLRKDRPVLKQLATTYPKKKVKDFFNDDLPRLEKNIHQALRQSL